MDMYNNNNGYPQGQSQGYPQQSQTPRMEKPQTHQQPVQSQQYGQTQQYGQSQQYGQANVPQQAPQRNYNAPQRNYNAPQRNYNAPQGALTPKTGWNWGAFMFNIWWGIGNKVYLPLICFIPVMNLIWPFVCGFKGNEWAMNSGTFSTVEEFNKTQETWNRAGKIAFFVALAFCVLYLILAFAIGGLIMSAIADSVSYY